MQSATDSRGDQVKPKNEGAAAEPSAMGTWGWGLVLATAALVAVAGAFVAGACVARRAAARAPRPAATEAPAASPDLRAVALAKVLIVSLRERGTGVLAQLPRASPEDERHLARVKDKVVEVDGEVRELRYEDGLFVGTIASPRSGLAYFVTPIAVEGIAQRRGRRFRGVPIALGSFASLGPLGEDVAGPSVVVVGAFDEAP
jgi:hypothetical protein